MNERIQELVGKAKFMAEETINRQISKNVELDAFAEKFAELIVRECANIDFRHKVGMTTDQEFDTSRVILEHFGVEE